MLKDVIDCYQDDALFSEAISVLEHGIHVYADCDGEIYDECVLDDFAWSSGLTKVCILFDEFVLKTGFAGSVCEYDDDGEPLDESIYIDSEENTAETEARVYERACKECVEKYFAEIVEVGNGVYAQERCDDTLWDAMIKEDVREKYIGDFMIPAMRDAGWCPKIDYDKLRTFCRIYHMEQLTSFFSEDTAYFLMQNLTVEELQLLYDFVRDYDINDIHSSNIGFVDGKIKIFDYCGCGSDTASLV